MKTRYFYREVDIKEVINNLDSFVMYGNMNTDFIYKDGGSEMLMCEYSKDCKYTIFTDKIKFAKRILRFIKTGY